MISNTTTVQIVSSSIPSWASGTIGAWTAIPNSVMTTDAFSVRMVPVPSGTDQSPQGAMSWSGVVAAYDQPAIYYCGGGHGNYAGNEIYRLGLTESPTWSRVIDSSPGPYTENTPYYPDGTPIAHHTYFSPCYDVSRKWCMWISKSDMWAASPSSDPYSCTAFDTNTNQWVTGNNNSQSGTIAGGMQNVPNTGGFNGGTFTACSNPVTGDQWYARRNASSQMVLYKWSTATQTWSLPYGTFTTVNWNSRGVLCVDTTTGDVWGFLNGQAPVRVTTGGVMTRPTLSGASASIFQSQLAAAHYVPSLNIIVATENSNTASRSAIYQLDCSTLACTQISTTGTVPSTTWGNGSLYKRFHYIPLLKGVFTIPQANTSAYFCRLHA